MDRPPAYPPSADPKIAEARRRTRERIRRYRSSWAYKTWPWLPLDGTAGLITIVGTAVALVINEVNTTHSLTASPLTSKNDVLQAVGRDGVLWVGLVIAILVRRARVQVRRFDRHQCLRCGSDLATYEGRCPKCGAEISN
jgi:hypothetical protein